MVSIDQIEDPFERYINFLLERHNIYLKKTRHEPWPWTDDQTLQDYSFCNVYREIDKTSIHYQKTVRNRYKEDPIVLPATVLYRWFNRIETCDALFNEPNIGNKSIFEEYIDRGCKECTFMFEYINNLPQPHVTGAFVINGAPGVTKGIGVMVYFHQWCQKPWEAKWNEWLRSPPSLASMYAWLQESSSGLGPFMTAQLVADLKYLPFMLNVDDWWSWAAPGPGSQRGLNAVLGRPIHQSWRTEEWLQEIRALRDRENGALAGYGLGPFHAQDTQNHCCEFSKYERARVGLRLKRRYHYHGQ